ncbi:hypothetical protein [Aureivirga marina]|uniref:hypothetical protein n=1 Tax=Aureivirga marina TaxID=1182451 RepID=UPI0018C9E009|nr:hypothetical protein [Aureivirga marina]
MEDKSYNKWDITTKIFSALLTIIVIIIGIYQYSENSILEFKRGFYSTQLEQYKKLTEITAKLSIIDPDSVKTSSFTKLKNEFRICYYGTVNMVSDKRVEEALINYYKSLEEFESKIIDSDELQQKALNLTQACRKSILKTWKLDTEKEYLLN